MVKANSTITLVSIIVVVVLIFPEVASQALSPSDSVASKIWFPHKFNILLQIFFQIAMHLGVFECILILKGLGIYELVNFNHIIEKSVPCQIS